MHEIRFILDHINLRSVLGHGHVVWIRKVGIVGELGRYISARHINDEALHLHPHCRVCGWSIDNKQLPTLYWSICHAKQSVTNDWAVVLRVERSVAVMEALHPSILSVCHAHQALVQCKRETMGNGKVVWGCQRKCTAWKVNK